MYTTAAVSPRKIDNTVNDPIETHSQEINPACLINAPLMRLSVY